AVRFLANFLDSNERVRQQWFPDRAQLFSDAMDMYPLVEEPPPTFEHAVEIAVELWRVHLESAANKGRYGVRRTKTNKRGSHSMSLMRKGVRLLRKGLRLER